MSSSAERIIATTMLVLLVAFALHAFFNFSAALLATDAQKTIDSLDAGRSSFTQKQLHDSSEKVAISQILSPWNTRYTELELLIGQILEKQEGEQTIVIKEYERLLALRPTWPSTWINYLAVSIDQNVDEKKLLNTLHTTLSLAPEKLELHFAILRIGMDRWLVLPESLKHAYTGLVEILVNNHEAKIKAFMKSHTATPYVCAYLNSQLHEKLCT